MVDSKIKSFEDLIVWQKAQDLAVIIYKITKNFPPEEKFGLTDQIRRSASSVSANIAEGFGRRTIKDKQHFYTMSYGSLLETKNFVYLAQKLNYINISDSESIIITITDCQKLINAITRSLNG